MDILTEGIRLKPNGGRQISAFHRLVCLPHYSVTNIDFAIRP